MDVKSLKDQTGSFAKAYKIIPDNLYSDFFKAIAELEDNECHRSRSFPHTRVHKISGTPKGMDVYRAYINKISGYRIHFKYGEGGFIELCDILAKEEHDEASEVVKKRKGRYK